MDAVRDQNHIPSRLGVLCTDGVTVIPIACNENNFNSMEVNTVDTITVTWPSISPRDENFVDVMMFVGTDGLTYPWAVDADGAVLIDM
jgi:hypothetical protein